jgi:hypothetical protein
MGKTYRTVSAAEFATLTVDDFRRYRAVVFGDPAAVKSIALLPTMNVVNLWKAATGNVMIIGTDELDHPPGINLLRAGLNFVSADLDKTGVYVTLSDYLDRSPPVPLTFLAPLTSSKAFTVAGQPTCVNRAHIVAASSALTGLTDAILSNWSCSVHGVFVSYPPEFIPLAIGLGAVGVGVQTFADGSVGIPYILVRG